MLRIRRPACQLAGYPLLRQLPSEWRVSEERRTTHGFWSLPEQVERHDPGMARASQTAIMRFQGGNQPVRKWALIAILQVAFAAAAVQAAEPTLWNLWPGKPPGDDVELDPEFDRTGPDGRLVAGRRVTRLTNVSTPTLAIFKPKAEIDTGTAVVIAPGGGHTILAYDLEGTEVAAWLNSIGVTGTVLKYRVPSRDPDKRWLAAAQDGQRAVSLVRARAKEIGIAPDRIGIIGFSAGGTPVRYSALVKERLYEPVDAYDEVPFRPDFAAPIYSGGIPEGAAIAADCPPFFMVITHDDQDRSIAVAELYIALKQANVSTELHIYESGGHGYGLRPTELPVTRWPDRMEEWMKRLGLLEPSASVR